MRRYLILILLFTACMYACSSPSGPPPEEKEKQPEPAVAEQPYKGGFTEEQRISDAKTIVALFERNYAPIDWKEESLGLSFEEHSANFLNDAAGDIGDEDFYTLIAKYLSAFRDSHISYTFPSSAKAELPLGIDEIEGKLIIVDVKEGAGDKISVGHELVAIDGRPAVEIQEELIQFTGEGNAQTARRFAASRIAHRPQSAIPPLPDEGKSVVRVRSLSDGSEKDVELEWKRTGFEFAEYNDPGISAASKAGSVSAELEKHPLKKLQTRLFDRRNDFDHISLGDPKPFFPMGEDFIERKEEPLYSGVFLVEDKRIGYIRIPDFYGGAYVPEQAIAQLAEDIPYFEESTDAMIIDETGNPGGNWCLALKLASFFFDKPFQDLGDRWRANRSNLSMLEEFLEYADEWKLTEEDMKWVNGLIDEIRQAMKTGAKLTNPYPICESDGMIDPFTMESGKQISYTKPILLLMNEMSVSCGDLFPALMKDNGRVTLFGNRTMGGGGSVEGRGSMGYSETSIRLTVSLVARNATTKMEDGKETVNIENVGIGPDIEYQITIDDFMSGFEIYRNSMLQAALSLIDSIGGGER